MFIVTVGGESKAWSLIEWALYDVDTRATPTGADWIMEYTGGTDDTAS